MELAAHLQAAFDGCPLSRTASNGGLTNHGFAREAASCRGRLALTSSKPPTLQPPLVQQKSSGARTSRARSKPGPVCRARASAEVEGQSGGLGGGSAAACSRKLSQMASLVGPSGARNSRATCSGGKQRSLVGCKEQRR